jgi:hypothetical protein
VQVGQAAHLMLDAEVLPVGLAIVSDLLRKVVLEFY